MFSFDKFFFFFHVERFFFMEKIEINFLRENWLIKKIPKTEFQSFII